MEADEDLLHDHNLNLHDINSFSWLHYSVWAEEEEE